LPQPYLLDIEPRESGIHVRLCNLAIALDGGGVITKLRVQVSGVTTA
jgi:hypothetical protein